ncbi:hypothetical protein [Phenylobacterium sp.]|uniref:hypothetical protein n=1 Tax=Phenylobacterium sp. TaxID=1871053 RepID=UPI002F41B508
MPAHFTHIYTARLIADHLMTGKFPDWPQTDGALNGRDPVMCGEVMKKWEKFTAIGAIGPDLFYFNQDWNNPILGPLSDEIMLAFAVFYFIDAAGEQDWEPLLVILAEASSQLADLLRFLIKLQKIWDDFVAGWNATIGPIVADIDNLIDALTGGVLSQFGVVLDELKLALKEIAEEELLTFIDIFSKFDTCLQKGFGEQLFLWSDMSHYRRPSALCQALVRQVDALAAQGMNEEAEQFLAFSLGYMTHLGIDTVAHSFVNEQCGGPYRNHPQRHHLIESHIDSFNYVETKPGGRLMPDPWGFTDEYPSVSQSALWFAIQLTPDDPQGVQRPPGPFPDDDTRQKALDVDGEMPDWMANSIVLAMMDCYQDPQEHPQIMLGDAFQQGLDSGVLTKAFKLVTGQGLDKPFDDLLKAIAPAPPFAVRKGFPLPWEVKTMYRIMYTFYRLIYNGTWELQKPKKPDFIIFPPASDVENLFQPPDLSGVDSSNPAIDVCEAIVALFEWVVKEIEAAVQLIGDLIRMILSPLTYPIRLALYELAMLVWDIITKTHEVLAHTGFFSPHPVSFYDDGELRLPNEIDIPLITLGGTVDSAFRQALADAFDPFGNLDTNQNVIGTGHSVKDPNHPYYPVLRWDTDGSTEDWEYKRPWAWPQFSPVQQPSGPDTLRITPTETYNPQKSFGEGPDVAFKPLLPGPYPIGTQPDVFFRTNAPVNEAVRQAYEKAQTPWETDLLNIEFLAQKDMRFSPLGDPIPFSCHLIGQLANDTGYSTQWNLDSDRAYAYLTWDWIRNGDVTDTAGGVLNLPFHPPLEPPEGMAGWAQGTNPLLLQYKDPPQKAAPPPPIK